MAKWTFRIDDVYRKDINIAFNTMLLADEVEQGLNEYLVPSDIFQKSLDGQFILDQVHPLAAKDVAKLNVQIEADKVDDAKADDILNALKDIIGKEQAV